MKGTIKERTLQEAIFMLETKETIRAVAKVFGMSKSTVHNDLSKRLKYVDPQKYQKVKEILDENFSQKHLRGGRATKAKYAHEKSK